MDYYIMNDSGYPITVYIGEKLLHLPVLGRGFIYGDLNNNKIKIKQEDNIECEYIVSKSVITIVNKYGYEYLNKGV